MPFPNASRVIPETGDGRRQGRSKNQQVKVLFGGLALSVGGKEVGVQVVI